LAAILETNDSLMPGCIEAALQAVNTRLAEDPNEAEIIAIEKARKGLQGLKAERAAGVLTQSS